MFLEKLNTAFKVSIFGVILDCIFPYSVRTLGKCRPVNSEYGHFSRTDNVTCGKLPMKSYSGNVANYFRTIISASKVNFFREWFTS